MLKLLNELKTYIEETQYTLESEYGSGRDLQQLIEQRLMPHVYYQLCEQIEKWQKGAVTVNKITAEHIESVVEDCQYHVFPNTTTTVCCLTLRNGYTVIGSSACVDPQTWNAEIGRNVARKHALEKIWPLEGYLLQQQLFNSRDGM